MNISIVSAVSFGASRSGLASRVEYSLNGGTTWSNSGVSEPVSGSGNYRATVTVTPPAAIDWRTNDEDMLSSSLILVSGGSGYTDGTGYALTFSGGSGTGAAGTFDVVSGAICNLTLTNAGQNYVSVPTISFSGAGSGTGASATCSLRTSRYAIDTVLQSVLDPVGLDDVILEPAAGSQPAINARQGLALVFIASPGGIISGVNSTTPITVANPAGLTTRMTITADPNGNRTSVEFNNLP